MVEERELRRGAIEIKFEEDKEHRHLPLLVSSRHCISSEFWTRFCSKALQQCTKISFQRSCSVKGLTRRDKYSIDLE